MGLATMPDLTNNKQKGQSIVDGNPIIICLHAPYHVEEDTVAHPIRW
jgi:hypothetical protein